MAFPVILVDSASGSDTAASGAGPSTALSGTTNASTDGTGLIVTLPAGTDTSGVSTTGSDVIFLNDTTAGARNFGKITGKAGSGGATPTVTVSDAFGLSLSSKSWAIGGKRASIGSTTSIKLFSNNLAAGDAMPGWVVEMQSGHTETLSATYNVRRAGDTTSGSITLRGASGAATMPILTFSNNGGMISVAGSLTAIMIRDFELRNTNATKTASIGVTSTTSSCVFVMGMRITHATDKCFRGLSINNGTGLRIEGNEIANCASHGILGTTGNGSIAANVIRDNGGAGVSFSSGDFVVSDNVIARNAGAGVDVTSTTAVRIRANVIHGNTGAGISLFSASIGTVIENNQITGSTGSVGVVIPGGTGAEYLIAQASCRNNNFGTGATANASGNITGGYTLDATNLNVDPGYVDPTNNNFYPGTAVKALGIPTIPIGNLAAGVRSYVDIGAYQRQEPAGGSTVVFNVEG